MVCYDISNDKRLKRVSAILENYGLRVQKSFFQCDMSKEEMESLKIKLLEVVKLKKDSLFIYPICVDCNKRAIKDGVGELLKLRSYDII